MNGVDDDSDFFTDLNDPDCECQNHQNLIFNPSFERYSILPFTSGQTSYSLGWRSAIRRDKASYMHLDGYTNGDFQQPLPDGKAFMQQIATFEPIFCIRCIAQDDWFRAYFGTILPENLEVGEKYILKFYVAHYDKHNYYDLPVFNLSIFGSEEILQQYFLKETECPIYDENWLEISKISYSPKNSWTLVSVEFTANFPIKSLIFGGSCNTPTKYYQSYGLNYLYYDDFKLYKKPEGISIVSQGLLCNDSYQLNSEITVENFTPLLYQWYLNGNAIEGENQSTISLNEESVEGNYSVRVEANNECYNSTDFNFTIPINSIEYSVEVNDEENYALLKIENNEQYEYSLDEITWQNTPLFTQLNHDSYEIFIRELNGCRLGSIKFTLFKFFNTLTPNQDTVNDYWYIKGISNYPNSKLKIYNSYGALVQSIIIKEDDYISWNGLKNNRKIPTETYWYTLELTDNRFFSGWVFIKNYE